MLFRIPYIYCISDQIAVVMHASQLIGSVTLWKSTGQCKKAWQGVRHAGLGCKLTQATTIGREQPNRAMSFNIQNVYRMPGAEKGKGRLVRGVPLLQGSRQLESDAGVELLHAGAQVG